MTKKNLTVLILLISICLGVLSRLYLLGKAPAGLYLDEAAQGYNAYSILKTGKDEFGKAFPVAFRSFNDFKTPVYIYLIVPLIPVFGLSSYTIRLPSFIFSILTLPLLYLLIKELLPENKKNYLIALFSTLLLSISPWHILFGRTNFECNVALFLMLLGYYLFTLGLKKPWYLLGSAISFAVAFPAYHSERLLVPLVLLFLLIKNYKTIFSRTHIFYTLACFVVGLALIYPTLKILTTPGFMARVSTLNIFSTRVESLPGYNEISSKTLSLFANGKWFLSIKEFLSLYCFYYSPRSLFLLGDSGERSSFPDLSVFYLWQYPLYIYGLWLLIKDKKLGKLKDFILLFFIISPIPAALTRDPFSTIRSLPLVIPMVIIMSLAMENIFSRIKSRSVHLVSWTLLISIVVYSVAKLYSSALILNEYYRAAYWDYGWEQVASTIKGLDPKLPIVVDNARGEPYSQLLVFMLPDPIIYQNENPEVSTADYYTNMKRNTNKKIGNITTRGIDWINDRRKKQYLVGDYLSISPEQIVKNHLLLIKEIYYPDGSPAYRIVETQPEKIPKK